MRSIKNTEDMLMGNYKFITCSKTNKHLSSLLSLSVQFFFLYLFFSVLPGNETQVCTLLMIGKDFTTQLCLEPHSVVSIEKGHQLP